MAREAQAHAAEETRKKEEIESRNEADSMVYQVEKLMREQGDKIPADIKSEVEGKVAAVRSALQGSDAGLIKSATQELSQTIQKIGTAAYGQSGQGGQTPPPGSGQSGEQPGNGPKDGTVEGEFREI